MEKLKNYIHNLTTPKDFRGRFSKGYWQERILMNLLLACVLLGFIVYFPSVALSIKEGLWIVVIADTLIYLFILFLFFYKKVSYNFKAFSFCTLSYLLGITLLAVLGPFGGGPVWLFAFPVITGLFLGFRIAAFTLIINVTTIFVTGLLLLNGFLGWGVDVVNPIEKWIVTNLNFMLLNLLVVLSVTSILKGLHDSLNSLQKSEEKYKRIFRNIQDVYYEESLDGIIQEISPSIEKILGYSRTELINKPSYDFYELPEKRSLMLRQILEESYINDYEINFKNKDGAIRACSINASLIKDNNQNNSVIVGIFRDISEQKKMADQNMQLQNQLNRARKMEALGLLAGGVAHDLNNILSSIMGYPELILLELEEDSPLIELLLAIKSSGQRAADIIQDMLTLSRRGVIAQDVVDLNEMVQNFIKTPEHQRIFKYHPASNLKIELLATDPFILGSPVHLSKTIMNLISNAAEAQTKGGTITVSTENIIVESPIKAYTQVQPGEYVILRVEDQGIGINESDLERIFEPFFTKKVMGRSGTGLGMSVVWGAVQDHNGYIDIKSELDSGTTFILYFPVTHQKKQELPKEISFSDYIGKGEHILVVDDLKEQRDIATAMLTKLNYRVSSVESGEKAIEFIKETSVELLILDMIMEPGMDGLDTYKRIIQINPTQKVIIASGFSETDRVKEMLSFGAKQYIKKPYGVQNIGVAIKKALSSCLD